MCIGLLFLCYIRDRRRMLLGTAVLGLAIFGLLWLYGLSSEQMGYCLLVAGVLGLLLFAAPDFIRYRRDFVMLDAMRKNALRLPAPVPVPSDAPLDRRLLLETVELLRLRTAELASQEADRQQELIEYYTLWIHQVKTPLAAMRLILQSEGAKIPEAEALRQELFKVERYMELVLGYLRIYSMSADLRLERRPVRPIAAQAVKKFATQFIYKKLSLNLADFSNQVVTDEKWLLFVLEQLISNAVKYTFSGEIRIDMDEDDVLTVSDTGVGIDPADLPRVCERGFTGRNGRAETTSTGLGLYLTKEVLDKLQNRMEIRSRLGEGTQVRLHLARPQVGRD